MATKKSTTTKKKGTASAKRSAARRPAAAGGGLPSGGPGKAVEITEEERWRMIAVAAYHKAEQRGFAPGHAVDDWLAAEREVNALLGDAE